MVTCHLQYFYSDFDRQIAQCTRIGFRRFPHLRLIISCTFTPMEWILRFLIDCHCVGIALEQRNAWLDDAKAIGIVQIVFGYVLRCLHSSGIEMPAEFYRITDSVIYSFHMPLFSSYLG